MQARSMTPVTFSAAYSHDCLETNLPAEVALQILLELLQLGRGVDTVEGWVVKDTARRILGHTRWRGEQHRQLYKTCIHTVHNVCVRVCMCVCVGGLCGGKNYMDKLTMTFFFFAVVLQMISGSHLLTKWKKCRKMCTVYDV